jgi:hypothetical protein
LDAVEKQFTIGSIASTIPTSGNFAQSFVAQKNHILLEKFVNVYPTNVNLTDLANQYVNFCDESFNVFLNEKIAATVLESEKKSLGKIRYEINCARKKKLVEADVMIREIMKAGGLKQMEAKLMYHLRRAEIDMAFMVILQLNIEDAINAQAEQAVQVMTHLKTLINEHQDKLVSAPVRLLRLLVRAEDANVRKQMLRQKLLIGSNALIDLNNNDENKNDAKSTTSPQCEHIVVQGFFFFFICLFNNFFSLLYFFFFFIHYFYLFVVIYSFSFMILFYLQLLF